MLGDSEDMIKSHKQLLLIDVLGALATCILTACLLASDVIPTGLPVNVLYCMALPGS